ncbi:hypothetical protein Tco_0502337, partial [Tanacetum coccineum]
MGLPEDIYDDVDSCETAQEIWLRVEQVMKGSIIEAQEKKAKLFNDWDKFNSTEGESIKSYYHPLSKLMDDLFRNKHFPEKIASNLNTECQESGIANQNGNGNVYSNIAEGNGMGTTMADKVFYYCRGLWFIKLGTATVQPRRRDATIFRLSDIEEVNANYILMANLQQASTSGTQTDKAPVYDSDGSACDTRDLS